MADLAIERISRKEVYYSVPMAVSGELVACRLRAEHTGLLEVIFSETALEVFLIKLPSHQERLDLGRIDSQDDTQVINGLCRLI